MIQQPTFTDWMRELDAIATSEGLEPKPERTEDAITVWLDLYEQGKTPTQAWNQVPYKNSRGEVMSKRWR